MAFDRWGFKFEGAFNGPSGLEARSGVYVIWAKRGEAWSVLDVGESADVRARVLGHDRKACWEKNAAGGAIYYTATYTPSLQQPGRVEIEQAIRRAASPSCGQR